MNHRKTIVLIGLIIVAISLSYSSKQLYNENIYINNIDTLNIELDKLIDKRCYTDSSKTVKIFFVFNIDSTGAVDSAYIRKSFNLKNERYRMICRNIELKYNLLFLYNEFKYAKDSNNIVSCSFLYKSKTKS